MAFRRPRSQRIAQTSRRRRQSSGTDELRRWVASQTMSDTGLLCFLSRVRGWAASSNIGLYYPLRSRDLKNFLDFESAVRRVETISKSDATPKDQRKLASELLMAIEQGKEI